MPITQERENIQELRAAGFTQQQAEVLAEKLEAASQSTSQDLKGFIRQELSALEARLDVRFAQMEARFAQMEARFERSLRLQLAAILTAFVGVTGLAVALIKLFPNAH
jgi:flagellar capping protein FliD